MNDPDPLDGADIGDREHVHTSEMNFHRLPEGFAGADRHVEDLDVRAEVVFVDGDSADVQLIWDGEVVKRLPQNWDQRVEPVTEAEKRRARRNRLVRMTGHALSLIIPAGFSLGIAWFVVQDLSQSLTVNGEPAGDPSAGMFLTLVLLMILSAIIAWGVLGGFPRKLGGDRR